MITAITTTAMESMTMMTNSEDTGQGRRSSADRLGMQSARTTVAEIIERETRLKRFILVGALASFLSLFGLTIVVDHQAQQVQQTAQTTSGATTSFAVQDDDDAPVVAQPQIRTRTS